MALDVAEHEVVSFVAEPAAREHSVRAPVEGSMFAEGPSMRMPMNERDAEVFRQEQNGPRSRIVFREEVRALDANALTWPEGMPFPSVSFAHFQEVSNFGNAEKSGRIVHDISFEAPFVIPFDEMKGDSAEGFFDFVEAFVRPFDFVDESFFDEGMFRAVTVDAVEIEEIADDIERVQTDR